MSFMKEFDHLKIPMKDIVSATNNFDRANVIGGGGFGSVYKGVLSLPEGQMITVAFKQLDRRYGQGNIEFWKEIMMLTQYKHENLISLMHFCIEGDEMILVYEYASRGSLDRYLGDTSLTWIQRLKICIGAARGLNFLHQPTETHQRIIHRDIKSANILLEENWTAKVSDFGLSKFGPANQPQTYVFSNVVGTPGYCDPLYWELGFLTKESDVYSFGVVLFEILCGRLCFEYRNGKLSEILVPKWRKCYVEKSLDDILLLGLKEQMDIGSYNSFSAIAFRCVNKDREERPMMAEIVKELEFALKQQEVLENLGKKVDIEDLKRIADLAAPPISYGAPSQILLLLLKGLFVDNGDTWISININGEVTKVVSATKCFFGDNLITMKEKRGGFARCKFPNYLWKVYSNRFRVEVNTQFLSPHVTYTIYIVFNHSVQCECPCYIPFEYKLEEETRYSTSCIAYVKQNGWSMTKLYQFTSYKGQENFTIEFMPRDNISFEDEFGFEGIEFQPLEYESCKKQEEKLKVVGNLDLEATDFTELIKLSKDVIEWTTKEELYFLLRKGFLIDKEKWLSISKNMKKRLILPASTFLKDEEWTSNSIPCSDSRFNVVTKSPISYSFTIDIKADLQLLSPPSTYSCHLIYKLSDNDKYSSFEGPMVIGIIDGTRSHVIPLSICLNTNCRTPIIGVKDDTKSSMSLNTCKMKGHPKLRKDGWMEVQFAEVVICTTGATKEVFTLSIEEEKFRNTIFVDVAIQGIEFRPMLDGTSVDLLGGPSATTSVNLGGSKFVFPLSKYK